MIARKPSWRRCEAGPAVHRPCSAWLHIYNTRRNVNVNSLDHASGCTNLARAHSLRNPPTPPSNIIPAQATPGRGATVALKLPAAFAANGPSCPEPFTLGNPPGAVIPLSVIANEPGLLNPACWK